MLEIPDDSHMYVAYLVRLEEESSVTALESQPS